MLELIVSNWGIWLACLIVLGIITVVIVSGINRKQSPSQLEPTRETPTGGGLAFAWSIIQPSVLLNGLTDPTATEDELRLNQQRAIQTDPLFSDIISAMAGLASLDQRFHIILLHNLPEEMWDALCEETALRLAILLLVHMNPAGLPSSNDDRERLFNHYRHLFEVYPQLLDFENPTPRETIIECRQRYGLRGETRPILPNEIMQHWSPA